MSPSLIIQNGRILDPANQRDETAELLVHQGRIVHALTAEQRRTAETIDASGLVVAPGLVDIHVHFRDPGQTHKETIATGSRCGAAGGFTTVVCMPNTSPVCDNAGTIQFIKDAAARDAVIRVYPTGTLTRGMDGVEMAPFGSLKRTGVVAVTDDGKCVQSNELMRRILEYANMFELPVFDHCQDYSLTEGSVMNEGDMSLKLGLQGWPAAAEDIIVARNAILSFYTGAYVHLQHITSAYSVDIVRRVKSRGGRITAEVTPHHLAFTEASLEGYPTDFKMNPPLRTEADRQALIEGVLDGTIDCICTDHAPHTDYEKDVEFDHAPFGIIGLETSLAVSLEVLYHSGLADLFTVIGLLTHRPARICSLPHGTLAVDAPADIMIFDPDEAWTVDPNQSFSKSRNCPWNGRELRGKVKRTLFRGETVYDGDRILRDTRETAPAWPHPNESQA